MKSDLFELIAAISTTSGPHVHDATGSERQLAELVELLRDRGVETRTIPLSGFVVERRLFEALSGAWQFPARFGKNWDAVSELLADLKPADAGGYVTILASSAHGMVDPVTQATTDDVFESVGEALADPLVSGLRAKSFHLVNWRIPGGSWNRE